MELLIDIVIDIGINLFGLLSLISFFVGVERLFSKNGKETIIDILISALLMLAPVIIVYILFFL